MTSIKLKYIKSLFFFLLVTLLTTFTITMLLNFKNQESKEVLPFGKQGTWIVYQSHHEKLLKKKKIKSVKALFYLTLQDESLHYIVSLKRHDKMKSKKDGRYEFLGGRVDKKEKVLTALIRETTEEDNSLTLARQLRSVLEFKPQQLKYKLITLKNGTTHAIFILPLKEDQWLELNEYYQNNNHESSETYGFERLDASYFSLEKKIKLNWTPQTIRIFKALRRE